MKKLNGRQRRKTRIRKKIFGSSERPRLSVFRSNRHLYVQIIDDSQGHTLVSVSTLEKGASKVTRNKAHAQELGKLLGEKAKTANVEQVVFDRNGYLFHGCLKSLAEGAREAGLKF